MSVVDFSKKKGIIGKTGDLVKLTIDSAIINAEKSLHVMSNTFDAALAAQGKLAAELTGKTVSLDDVMDTSKNIWCPDGQFVPSDSEEEFTSSEQKEVSSPLTKEELLEIIKENNKAQEERFLDLLEVLKKAK